MLNLVFYTDNTLKAEGLPVSYALDTPRYGKQSFLTDYIKRLTTDLKNISDDIRKRNDAKWY